MKTMKKAILTALAVAAFASAQAQTTYATIGEVLPISSAVEASGGNVVYEWYYNGNRIVDCNGAASCVVPSTITASFTDGQVVQFYRRAIAQDCAVGNTKNTTPITITFVTLAMNGVRWANYHSTTPNPGLTTDVANKPTFASGHTSAAYRIFQFNRPCAWAATEPAGTPCGAAWNTTPDNGGNWNETTAPVCPTGWRLPTVTELSDLNDNSNPIGGRRVTAAESGFSVAGFFFGVNAGTCSSGNMAGCVFFPASGERHPSTGVMNGPGSFGFIWSATQSSATTGFNLRFPGDGVNSGRVLSAHTKAYGFPVRCVQ